MANGRIFATRFGADKVEPNTVMCPRCGIVRATGGVKGSRSKLCRSCVSSLNPEELKIWRSE